MSSRKKKKNKGITYIELVLVIAVFILVAAMSFPLYSNFILQNAVSDITNQLKGDLRKAQVYALEGKGNSNWGVNYGTNSITLYKGNSYATRSTGFDEIFPVNPNITVSGGYSLIQDSTSASGNRSNLSTISWSHTVGTGSNTILIVGLVTGNTTTFTGVTWNTNQPLTHYGMLNCPAIAFSYGCHVDVWYLTAPVTGTHTISATSSIVNNNSGGAVSYSNVNQTTPFGIVTSATGSTTGNQLVGVAATSSAGQTILGIIGSNNTTVNGSGTQLWNDSYVGRSAGESKPATGGSVTLDWYVNSGDWGAYGIQLNPTVYSSGGGGGTVTFDASSSTSNPLSVSTLTWSHTTTTSSNRLLLVQAGENFGYNVNSITYAGVPLAQVNSMPCASYTCQTELWYLVNPATGPNNVVVTFSGASTYYAAGASTYYNVNTASPLGTSVTSSTNITYPSITATSTTSQLIVDALTVNTTTAWTAAAGQTQIYNLNPSPNTHLVASSYKSGQAPNTTLSWTSSSPSDSAEIAVPINPGTGGSSSQSFDVNFSRSTGTPSASVFYSVTGSGNNSKIIIVNSQGIATQ